MLPGLASRPLCLVRGHPASLSSVVAVISVCVPVDKEQSQDNLTGSAVWLQAQRPCQKGTCVFFGQIFELLCLFSLYTSRVVVFGNLHVLMSSESGKGSPGPVCTGTAVRFRVQAGAENGEWAERVKENSNMLSTLRQFASCEPLWSLRTETKYMLLSEAANSINY
uniref:Uncharacterized protein n=1 Tax=Molossus molossus TaxID=27622 RepID=A0A7J8J061_MOLMO|nr:hypothetical protein HJG59_010262 [Molossus molossus]